MTIKKIQQQTYDTPNTVDARVKRNNLKWWVENVSHILSEKSCVTIHINDTFKEENWENQSYLLVCIYSCL